MGDRGRMERNENAYEIAEKCGVKVWKVYYVRQKLKLDRLPTVEEVLTYKGQVGRPLKDVNYVPEKKKRKR
jgi:hypothetical protein